MLDILLAASLIVALIALVSAAMAYYFKKSFEVIQKTKHPNLVGMIWLGVHCILMIAGGLYVNLNMEQWVAHLQ